MRIFCERPKERFYYTFYIPLSQDQRCGFQTLFHKNAFKYLCKRIKQFHFLYTGFCNYIHCIQFGVVESINHSAHPLPCFYGSFYVFILLGFYLDILILAGSYYKSAEIADFGFDRLRSSAADTGRL